MQYTARVFPALPDAKQNPVGGRQENQAVTAGGEVHSGIAHQLDTGAPFPHKGAVTAWALGLDREVTGPTGWARLAAVGFER